MIVTKGVAAKKDKASFFKRFYIYQKERFPLLGHGALILSFSFSAVSYSRICRGAEGFIPLSVFFAGAFVTVTIFFLVRVFDEFKDAEDDAQFRSYLPVPRGLISFKELTYMAVAVVALQVLVQLLLFPKMLLLYALVMGYLLLMGKEFFVPTSLKAHQPVYVASHMIIIPLVDCYASGLDWYLEDVRAPLGLLFFFGVSYMNGVVIEFGRKIRVPEKEEHGVLTYSALYGANRATLLWLGFMLATLGLSFAASANAGYGVLAYALLSFFFVVCSLPGFIFLNNKSVKLSKTIEYASALWTVAMYLTLGAAPMLNKLLTGS
ncbi:MAG TPA: hypothetical protein VEY71_00325 [Chitinophagales bacterium]|nr:hypothetical protein [Chitinophagales bacterium]